MLGGSRSLRVWTTWRIAGYDGTTPIFEATVPGHLAPMELTKLLQRLASKHLSEADIVAASLRKNSKGYSPVLEPQIEALQSRCLVTVGNNPFYVASKQHGEAALAKPGRPAMYRKRQKA
jgi:hypothetical protein